MFDPKCVVHQEMVLEPSLSHEERPKQSWIGKKELRNKSIIMKKVLWKHHGHEEDTWKLEDKMKEKHTELFE